MKRAWTLAGWAALALALGALPGRAQSAPPGVGKPGRAAMYSADRRFMVSGLTSAENMLLAGKLAELARQVGLTARYGIPLGADGGELYVFTDWAYRSEVNFFLYESVEFRGKSSLEGGLRVGYNWNYGDYEVALFGRNITDQTRIVGGIDFNNLTGFLNEPRTLGLEFTAKF